MRFIGGGIAPYAAGKLAERYTDSVPFYVGAAAMLIALAIFFTGRTMIDEADRAMAAETPVAREAESADGLESFGGGETTPEPVGRPA